MVTRDTAWPNGTPCWADLGVDDIPKAITFYSGVFGWEIHPGPPEAGGYAMCMQQGKPVAGIGPKQGPAEMPSVWTTYLAADDADASASKIGAAGGTVLVAPMDVMDVGRMTVATDPGGSVFGVWQARKHTGFGLANEPGSVAWNENMSRAFEANKAFYLSVFGYEYNDISSPEMTYGTLRVGGQDVAGIGAMGPQFPAEVPAHWGLYFSVPDADEAVKKVSSLGGQMIAPAFDTPYGRMAPVLDDQGAAFSVVSVPAS